MIPILALLLQSAAPAPLTAPQQRDLDCVATFALIARDQAAGVRGADRLRPLGLAGKTYAGLVGSRLVAETGLPREAIGAAIAGSAQAQDFAAAAAADPRAYMESRFALCAPLLDAEIADGGDLPLPVPRR